MLEREDPTKGLFYEIRSPAVDIGAYVIALFKKNNIVNGMINLQDLIPIFKGETLAEDMMTPQIINSFLSKGTDVAFILNPEEPFEMDPSKDFSW